MTLHVPPTITGFITLALCLALTWLCNNIARHAVNKVLYRKMQRLTNLLPTVGIYMVIDSWFADSGLPSWLHLAIVVALTTFILCVSFNGEVTWYKSGTPYTSSRQLSPRYPKHWHDDTTPPTYC